MPPNGGYTGFKARQAYTHNLATWLQGAGYRTIHIGKFLNGYGDEPFDDGKDVPPGWSAWHTVLQGRHRPLLLRLHAQRQRRPRRSLGDSGQLGHARIRRTRRLRLPQRAAQRQTLLLRDRHLQPHRQRRADRDLAGTALLPADRLHRPARRLPPPGRPGAGDAPLRHLRRRPLPAQPLGRLQRGQRQRQAALHPRSALPLAERHPHLPRLLPEGAGVAALDRRRRQADRRHARRPAPAAQHLHHLHLRQRLLLRRAPADRRQVPRLRAGHPPAVPDPRAGDQARAPRPASWRRTSTSPRRSSNWPGAEADKSIDGRSLVPYMHDPALRIAAPDPLRVLRRDRRRRRERRTDRAARPAQGSEAPRAPTGDGASASIVAPPKDYEGIRLGPYKYIEWPDGEKELYDITKDPYELNNIVRDRQPLPDPRLPPRPAGPPRDLRRPHLSGSGAEIPADPRAAAQGRQAAARRRTAERKGTRRKAAPQAQRVM